MEGRGGIVTLVEMDMGGDGKMRSGKSPPVNSDKLPNLLKMVVDESGEEFTPHKAGLLKNLFVLMGICTRAGKVFKSRHLLYKEARDEKRVLTLSISVAIAGQAKKTILLPRVSCQLEKKYEQVEVHMPWGLDPLR